ncbi:MAG: tRNA pseudouridine(55) synthase TruB [Burkholderiaceae bacterium]
MTKRATFPIDGVLLLDKPVGPSSTRVLGHVKHLLNAAKAGHGGTLDPMASGLLPLMFGEATKYAAHGLDADKTYEAQIVLGSRTTTADREGEVIAQAAVPDTLSREQINAVLAQFMGPQDQVPPMHSALKKDGRALYAYARTGQTVERAPRRIIIHAIALTEWASPLIGIRVGCSKGTYIRTLAEDIGQALGLPAHLHSLRRVAVGDLQAHDMVALSAIEQADPSDREAFLKPVDWLIRDWPAVVLDRPQEHQFVHGQAVTVTMTMATPRMATGDGAHTTHQQVRVQNRQGVFLGTGRIAAQRVLHPERLRVLSS